MSFTTVLAMIQSLRQNARPKRKAFEYTKDKKAGLKDHYALKYKKVSLTTLKNIKSKIRRQSEKEDRRKLYRTLFLLSVASIALILFTINYSNSVRANNARIVKERNERLAKQQEENEAYKNMDIIFFLDAGEKNIEEKSFQSARNQYNLALDIAPDNYKANLGLVKAYIFDCFYNNKNCYNSNYLLEKTIEKFGNTKELKELQTKLDKTLQNIEE